MKSKFFYLGLGCCLLAGTLLSAVGGELKVPGFTAYLQPDSGEVEVSGRSGVVRWTDPGVKVLWFGQFKQTGTLKAAVELKLPRDKETKLRLNVAGSAREASAKADADGGAVIVDFGSFEISRAGFQEFRLESLNEAGKPAGDIQALLISGPACEGAHFNLKPRRNAASVHMNYPLPEGVSAEAFYCEVTAAEDPVTTFYMACGFHRGYFGMQVNSPTERRIIFSVWDSGNEAVDRAKVNPTNRVTLVAKGEGVYTGDFGNEGTGGHSHLKYLWKTGVPQKFLVTAEPDGTRTRFSGFYFHPDKQAWMLISSWSAPKEGGYLRGLHSFSENFWGDTGHLRRKAFYGNQWVRTPAGKWIELTEARFSHDPTGKQDRLDRFMGVEDGRFFLSHGGFVDGFTAYGDRFNRPATGKPPVIQLPEIKGLKPFDAPPASH